MIALIHAMFAAPEAQSDPYVWAAALAGHWAIGAGFRLTPVSTTYSISNQGSAGVDWAELLISNFWEG